MCVPMCTLRLPLVVKAFPQIVHLNGLSPVCVLMCICSADADENGFWHIRHMCFRFGRFTNGESLLLLPGDPWLLAVGVLTGAGVVRPADIVRPARVSGGALLRWVSSCTMRFIAAI